MPALRLHDNLLQISGLPAAVFLCRPTHKYLPLPANLSLACELKSSTQRNSSSRGWPDSQVKHAQSKRSPIRPMKGSAIAAASQDPPPVVFYSHGLCPYAQRVALVLEEKGIEYRQVEIDLSDKPSWYLQKIWSGLVPAVEIDGQVFTESIPICRMLSEKFPGPALLSEGLAAQQEAEQLIDQCEEFLRSGFAFLAGPGQRAWSLNVDRQQSTALGGSCFRERAAFTRDLKWFEKSLRARGGPYLMGSNLTLADLIYFPFLDRFALASAEFQSFDVETALIDMADMSQPGGSGSFLGQWLGAMRSRPSWKKTFPDPKVLMSAYRRHRSLDYFDFVSATFANPNPL